jgi:hypothetical protein
MAILNHRQSAEGAAAVVAAATESQPQSRAENSSRFLDRRLWIYLFAGLLIAAGTGELTASASARGMNGGSVGGTNRSVGSSSSGRTISAPTQGSASRLHGLHARSILSTRRFGSHRDRDDIFADDDFGRSRDFRRFRHHRDEFADTFFPFGFSGDFGSPVAQSDLSAAANGTEEGDDGDSRGLPFRTRGERYERPSVEKTPSGVTIIRGPGSHHISP